MRTYAAGPRCGATLVELVVVLVILAILAGLAVPIFNRWIAVHRVNSAMNYVRGDVHYARMLAVRSGQRVELRFLPDGGSCATEYRITVLDDPPRIAKRVRVGDEIRGVCLTHSNPNSTLTFNSRGLPRGVAARTFRASLGTARDSIRMSQVGRLYRAN